MDDNAAWDEYQQATDELARLCQRFQGMAVKMPAGEDSSPGRVRRLPALRAVIECTLVDRLDPALETLRTFLRLRRNRRALNRPRRRS